MENETGKSSGLLNYRLRLLESAGRSEDASAVRAEIVETAWDNAQSLNEIAWNTATRGKGSDLELALKAAIRASELTDDQDASILDTVARCQYELGQLDEAIKWQRLAVEHNKGIRGIDQTLNGYMKEKAEADKSNATDETTPEKEDSPNKDSDEESSEEPGDSES